MQPSKNKHRTPSHLEAVALFQELRANHGVRQREIAAATGINQGSVSKILRGSFKAVEGRAYEVWKYARQRVDKNQHDRSSQSLSKTDPRLTEKIDEVWDGTEAGARALLKLLDAADLMQKRRGSSE
jgi:transcriptional regulator with XRE-family HTH domain